MINASQSPTPTPAPVVAIQLHPVGSPLSSPPTATHSVTVTNSLFQQGGETRIPNTATAIEKAKKMASTVKNELLRTEDELKMQKILDLLKGRIVWSKNYWTDFWYNLRNNHPLIGCFLADPVHPFSRGERMVVLAMSLGVAYIITVVGVLFTPEEGFTRQQVLVGIIISSLIQTIVDGILVAAAKCSCCYGPSIPVAVTKFFEVQGKLCLLCMFVVIFGILGGIINNLPKDLVDKETGLNPVDSPAFYAKWLLAKILSWLWDLPKELAVYNCTRSSQIYKNPHWVTGAILNKEGTLLGTQMTETRIICQGIYPLKVHTQVAVVASPKVAVAVAVVTGGGAGGEALPDASPSPVQVTVIDP
jgi:hypothetical protein